MNQQIQLIDIIRVLFKKRVWIIGFCALSAIASVVITLLKPDYYKSTSTFYAASDDLSSPDMIFGNSNDAMQYYGTDDDADRVLSIGLSSEFIAHIIGHFNLYDHYKVDTSKNLYKLKTQLKFRKNYSLQRNKYDAIELSIEDQDPVLAANMTNYARVLLNDMTSRMIKSSQEIILEKLSKEIANQETLLQVISDSLKQLKTEYGIINPEIQGEKMAGRYNRIQSAIISDEAKLEYLNELRGSYSWKRDSIAKITLRLETNKAIKSRMDDIDSSDRFSLSTFTEGSNAVISLETFFSDIKNKLVQHKLRFQNVKSVYESSGQAVILVEEGVVPDKKSRPRRSILVIGATMAAFIFSILGILIYEAYSKIDWDSVKK